MESDVRTLSASPHGPDHLCVLVHGLWGNPTHLNYIEATLREKYGENQLFVLNVKRNSGSFTYDGIETGGERVAQEIEETLDMLARDGHEMKKLSIVGYSLGGLVSRYAIGLLHSRGWFEKIQPVNFTTFVTPHLGVRTPLRGYANHVWNVFGGRVLSMSGRQLFLIDKFRDTGRPLLSVLADPDSIFIHGLAKFSDRCLYANIVNDRSAVYYTTAISRIDPFANLRKVNLHYQPGYEPIVLDPELPVTPHDESQLPTFYSRITGRGQDLLQKLPLYLFFVFFIPIGSVAFLINSGVQTIRSNRRIRLHEQGLGFGNYRVPLLVREMRQAVETTYESVNAAQSNEYLPSGSEEVAEGHEESRRMSMDPMIEPPLATPDEKLSNDLISQADSHSKLRPSQFPTLALTSGQFAMIKALDEVGFRKYGVHIHLVSHSHAAIIVRKPKKSFEEGKTVIRHWLTNEFKI